MIGNIDDNCERLADSTGSIVVPHSWGLIPLADLHRVRYTTSLPWFLPKGYALGLRSSIITPPDLPPEFDKQQLHQGIYDYMKDRSHRRRIRANQGSFTYGTEPTTQQSANWLTGIDVTSVEVRLPLVNLYLNLNV